MALIPPFFLDCVVAIGVPIQANQVAWIGSGFLVGRPIDEKPDQYHVYIVTNKHVIEKHKNIFVRFNKSKGLVAQDYPIDLAPNNNPIWVGHNDKEVDVAAFQINPNKLKGDGVKYHFFALDKHSMTSSTMQQKGVSEGDCVFVLGFPMGSVSMPGKYNYVIARNGSIARIRDVLEGEKLPFMIDSAVFPGNSGGPVVLSPQPIAIEGTKTIREANLVGIVKSYVPYTDVAISQQTQRPRVIFEENSGLALVETVDSIQETVNLCFDKFNPKP